MEVPDRVGSIRALLLKPNLRRLGKYYQLQQKTVHVLGIAILRFVILGNSRLVELREIMVRKRFAEQLPLPLCILRELSIITLGRFVQAYGNRFEPLILWLTRPLHLVDETFN